VRARVIYDRLIAKKTLMPFEQRNFRLVPPL